MLGDPDEGVVEEVYDTFAQGGCLGESSHLNGEEIPRTMELQDLFVLVHHVEVLSRGGGEPLAVA